MRRSIALLGLLLMLACRADDSSEAPKRAPVPRATTASEGVPEASAPQRNNERRDSPARSPAQVLEEFGRRMKNVSTLAPPAQASAAIRSNYGQLTDEALLARWIASPQTAPGRQVSSPWPDRIEVRWSRPAAAGTTVVGGTMVEMTSSGESGRVPVEATLRETGGQWRISGFETKGQEAPEEEASGATAAVRVVEAYYRDINAKHYAEAWHAWGEDGPPGQTLAEFSGGFRDTAAVRVTAGPPSRIGAAAGSRYVTVPVTVRATLTSGRQQQFRGTYVLRRSVVDGATAAQRRWHIDRATLREVR